MANCFTPNSTPAIGRTSTRSSKRLKNSSRASASFLEAFGLTNATLAWTLRFFNVQRSTLNAQRSIQIIGRWMLDCLPSRSLVRRLVGRWTFSSSWRVKGAWWPSRSSKPSSPRKWRGRFDSYPLREFLVVILSGAKRSRRVPWPYREVIDRASSTSLGMTNNSKGGDLDVA
jgi:hypothetical protein